MEASIFESFQNKTNWLDLYWKKVHAIVAAVCGKTDAGSLLQLLMAGQFREPKDLLDLTDKQLGDSFEGRVVILPPRT